MSTALVSVIIAAISALSGVMLGWIGQARTARKAQREKTTAEAEMRYDMEYLKRGIDDIRLEQKSFDRKIDTISERLTRVEESSKQAHKRIDRIEEREPR